MQVACASGSMSAKRNTLIPALWVPTDATQALAVEMGSIAPAARKSFALMASGIQRCVSSQRLCRKGIFML